MSSIHAKLQAIQSDLKAPKNNTNSFGKYKYRSCEDILEAVKPLLKEQGLTLTLSDEIVEVGGRIYVKATATLHDASGGMATVSAFAREQEAKLNKEGKETMDHAQITGAASSYARKYALNGLFCIDDTKDADATNDHAPKAKESTLIDLAVESRRAKITQLCKDTGTDEGKLYSHFTITKETLTRVVADSMIASLEKKLSSQIDSAA